MIATAAPRAVLQAQRLEPDAEPDMRPIAKPVAQPSPMPATMAPGTMALGTIAPAAAARAKEPNAPAMTTSFRLGLDIFVLDVDTRGCSGQTRTNGKQKLIKSLIRLSRIVS